jgi:hypothetical protein
MVPGQLKWFRLSEPTRWFRTGARVVSRTNEAIARREFDVRRSRFGGRGATERICRLAEVSSRAHPAREKRRPERAVAMEGDQQRSSRATAAEQEIASDNRPSSLRSGGRLRLNFSRYADQRHTVGMPVPTKSEPNSEFRGPGAAA